MLHAKGKSILEILLSQTIFKNKAGYASRSGKY